MKITYAPKGVLQIDDARIIFRNFSGKGGKYNAEGNRNFCMIIPNEEIADELISLGWNVTVKPPREEGEEPLRFLKVKVKFDGYPPIIYLRSGKNTVKLDEETVGSLDSIDISKADLDISPYEYDVNGRHGISAYLKSMCVYQEYDRFAERFSNEDSDDTPF